MSCAQKVRNTWECDVWYGSGPPGKGCGGWIISCGCACGGGNTLETNESRWSSGAFRARASSFGSGWILHIALSISLTLPIEGSCPCSNLSEVRIGRVAPSLVFCVSSWCRLLQGAAKLNISQCARHHPVPLAPDVIQRSSFALLAQLGVEAHYSRELLRQPAT